MCGLRAIINFPVVRCAVFACTHFIIGDSFESVVRGASETEYRKQLDVEFMFTQCVFPVVSARIPQPECNISTRGTQRIMLMINCRPHADTLNKYKMP